LNSHRFTPPYNDDAIVAWIDGEMNPADAQRFEEWLKSDEQLSGRTAELMKSSQDYRGAFADMLNEAPVEKMQARLDESLQPHRVLPGGVSRRALVAASFGFLVLGSGLGYVLRPSSASADENAQIRDLEAQYMSLYSAETLLDMDLTSPVLQRGLARVVQDIGLPLLQSQLSLSGSELKMVRMLRYDATSIAQIAWINMDYGPMALCISPTEQKTTVSFQQEQRHSMNMVWWHRAGYQFVLIGRNPHAALQASARQLYDALA